MMQPIVVRSIDTLAADRSWWVPATVSPVRDWPAAPGCRRGQRYLVDAETLAPARTGFPAFETRAECLRWILSHRADLAGTLPGARVEAAALDRWMLGMTAH